MASNEWEKKVGKGIGIGVEYSLRIASLTASLTARELARKRRVPQGVLLATLIIGGVASHYGEPYLPKLFSNNQPTHPGPEGISPGLSPTPNITNSAELSTPEAIQNLIEVFSNKDANEVLNKYGMNAGTFFKFDDSKVLEKMTAFKSEQLYPIYPPSVIEQKDLIYKYAQKYHTHPNVIAMLMSIESAGNPDAGSNMGAQGLMQAMPDKFSESIRKNNPELMKNPDINIDVGANYFVNVCIPAALRELGGKYNADHPNVIAKAAIFYNGGPGHAEEKFEDLPEESKFYGDHIMRYILTSQIAGELRLKGYTDRRIVESLSSKELDARSFALQQFHSNRNGNYLYSEYEEVIKKLGQAKIEAGNSFYQDYMKYRSNPFYELPLSVGARVWVGIGGITLLSQMPKNMDKTEWLNIDTRRN